jgi:CBS domain-containing protein
MDGGKREDELPDRVSDVMTPDPYEVGTETSIQEAARIMRDADIGDVLVLRTDGSVCGIITDRDLVVRGVADGIDPTASPVESVCRHEVISIESEASAAEAVELMRRHNIRRLPVIDSQRLVGIVSLGDLAIDRDPTSALADISNAPPNN